MLLGPGSAVLSRSIIDDAISVFYRAVSGNRQRVVFQVRSDSQADY